MEVAMRVLTGCVGCCVRRGVARGVAVAAIAAVIGVAVAAWSIGRQGGGRESTRADDMPGVAAGAGLDGSDDRDGPGAGGLDAEAQREIAERGRQIAQPVSSAMLAVLSEVDDGGVAAGGSGGIATWQMDELRRELTAVLDEADAVEGLGLGLRDDLASAVRAVLEPCVAGDRAAFDAAMASLGCGPGSGGGDGDDDEGEGFFDRLSGPLAGASLGLGAMRVGEPKPPMMTLEDGFSGAMIRINRNKNTTPDGTETETVAVTSEASPGRYGSGRVLNFGASELRGVEVAVPFRSAGDDGEGVVSLVMVRDPEVGAWQPARASLAFGSMEAARRFLPIPGGIK